MTTTIPQKHPAIRQYLTALETKLRQTPGVDPEEGLADAEEFLQSEWESVGDRQGSFSDDDLYRHFVRKFGPPDDVAAEYAATASPGGTKALAPAAPRGGDWRLWGIVGVMLAAVLGIAGWAVAPLLFPQPAAPVVIDRQVWASRVVSFQRGNPPAKKSTDPAAALGAPDCRNGNRDAQTYVALGRGGELVLEFSGVWLCDGSGPDLTAIEIGPLAEPFEVAISPDGQTWTKVGKALGAQSVIDIAPFVKPGYRFRFVRLIDAKSPGDPKNAWPGADIDAVGAYHVAGE